MGIERVWAQFSSIIVEQGTQLELGCRASWPVAINNWTRGEAQRLGYG